MKFLISLVLIIVLINNFYFCNGESIISLKNFQYDQYGCRGDSSASGAMSTGSFALEGRELGNVDGGNSQSASWSSSIATCDNIELANELFIVIGACVQLPGNDEDYFIYRIDYENGTISRTMYSEYTCKILNQYTPYAHYKIDECVEDCKLSGPYLYTIIESSEIEIPKNTLVEFDYTGACGEGWKTNFIVIKYTPINRCLLTSENTAFQVTCNSTNFDFYYSVNQNNCIRWHSEYSYKTGVQSCQITNKRTFCNI